MNCIINTDGGLKAQSPVNLAGESRLFQKHHFSGDRAGICFHAIEIYAGGHRIARAVLAIENNRMLPSIKFTIDQSAHLHTENIKYAELNMAFDRQSE